MRISSEEKFELKSIDKYDTSIVLNSFLKRIFDIAEMKKKYEEDSTELKQGFYRCCDCCGNFLDCCCCQCCNYELFCCFKKLCPCCVCSVINTNNEENINIDDLKGDMNDFKEDEKKIIKSLESLRNTYIIKNDSNKNETKKISRCEKIQKILCFIGFSIVSLIHYFQMAVIEAILFSLINEVFRTLSFKLFQKCDENDGKEFEYYIKIASKDDTSLINFNYLSSFFTNFFVSKTNIPVTYILSNLIIIISVSFDDII